jgi:DNA topoisomerase VI subunit A
MINCEREDLNIQASNRGLYAGLIRRFEHGVGIVDGTEADPMPINSNWITNPFIQCESTSARFILVVEKEGSD